MVSRNLNQLKFFIYLFFLLLDTNARCLRLETFDQAEVKIALSRQLLVLPTCYYIIHLVQYHSVLVVLYAPQNAIMLLYNYAIIPV